MHTYAWPRPAGVPRGVAVLLPGVGYTAQGPVLGWSAEVLVQQGWHVQAVAWEPRTEAGDDPFGYVAHVLETAFAAAPDHPERLVVGKSFGTRAAPWAAAERVPGIWLTPLFRDPHVVHAFGSFDRRSIAIGGDADEHWQPDALDGTAARVITVPGADHSLTIPGDWRRSLAIQRRIFETIDAHVGHLTPSNGG